MANDLKKRGKPMPLKPGDAVVSYMRPDQRYIVVDINRAGKMVQCRTEAGDAFWCARTVLRRVEVDDGSDRIPGGP